MSDSDNMTHIGSVVAPYAAKQAPGSRIERVAARPGDLAVASETSADRYRRLAKRMPPSVAAALCDGSFAHCDATLAVVEWAASGTRGLMLRGGVGAGKSLAAALPLLSDVVFAGASWHRPDDFVSAVLHAYDDRAPKLGSRIVVVDDVGRETKADLDEALCAFIDDKDTRFILTTNLKREDFRKRYDARLVDRLNHCAIAITVKGESRRKQTGGF